MALALLIMGGLIALGWSASIGWTWLRLHGETASADGWVSRCTTTYSRGSESVHIEVTYLVPNAGSEVLKTPTRFSSCGAARNQHLPVLYLVDAPDVAMTRERFESAPASILTLFILGVVFLGGGVALFAFLNRRETRAPDTADV